MALRSMSNDLWRWADPGWTATARATRRVARGARGRPHCAEHAGLACRVVGLAGGARGARAHVERSVGGQRRRAEHSSASARDARASARVRVEGRRLVLSAARCPSRTERRASAASALRAAAGEGELDSAGRAELGPVARSRLRARRGPRRPAVRSVHSSLPTTIGLPRSAGDARARGRPQGAGARGAPPAAIANGSPAKDPMIEELSGSMLLDDSNPAMPAAGLFAPPPREREPQGAVCRRRRIRSSATTCSARA